MKPLLLSNRQAALRMQIHFGSPHSQRGASLIEILVAVLILSFGLLGIAALQTRALQGNQSSLQRSQAVMLNNSMLDAMRIDRENAKLGTYNIAETCSPAGIGASSTLENNNRRDWLTAARDNMGGSASTPVCGTINCSTSYVCVVSLKWDDSRSGGLTTQTLTIEGKL
jgi:type IV pilus assembly protein PilV